MNKDPNNRSRRRKGTTIEDIAREAGVSTATVSRVFNSPEKVSNSTREVVEAVARRHHFVADGLATGLASRKSSLLGVIIPTISNSIYSQSTQAIQDVAQAAGYTVLVGVSDFSRSREERLIHRFIEHRVEGIVLTGAKRGSDVYEKINRNGLPYIVTWKLDPERRHPCVSFDNARASMVAVEHLIALGHRRIGFVCGRTDVNDRALERKSSFEARMAAHGLSADPKLMFERPFEYVEGSAVMRRMLENPDPPTAVFCANDIQAIGAMAHCHEAGLEVPRDISIIGFDDLAITQYTTPQLTTVHVPAAEMGRSAAQQLVTAIRDGGNPMSMELPVQLIVRGTTGPPSRVDHGESPVGKDGEPATGNGT